MGSKHDRRGKLARVLIWILLALLVLTGSSLVVAAAFRNNTDGFSSPTHSVKSTSSVGIARTPMPTTTETPALEQTATPLFYEDFTDNSKGWAITNTPDFTRTLEDNQLTLAVTNHNILTETVPTTISCGDCTVDVQFTLRKADANDSVGLYVRGDGLLFHDYRIDIFGNRTVALSKEYLDADKKPQTQEFEKTGRIAGLMTVGKPNTVTVIMKGPYIMLRINDTTIKTLVDSDYPRGQIALFVNNGQTSDGVTASFSSIKITKDPAQLPGLPISPTVTPIANQ